MRQQAQAVQTDVIPINVTGRLLILFLCGEKGQGISIGYWFLFCLKIRFPNRCTDET